jgi:hypothetical protein
MAGGFPKAPALRAARFARCCTTPPCSLIYHCVHLLSLPSLSLVLPRRSKPCCRALQFYVGPLPALVVCFSSLRDSRTCTNLSFVGSSARRQWPRPWLRSVSPHSIQDSCTFMATWPSNTRAGSARLSPSLWRFTYLLASYSSTFSRTALAIALSPCL